MSNAYQRRMAHRLNRQRQSQSGDRFLKLLEVDNVQVRYESAWFELHGTKVKVSYAHGWYWVLSKAYRQSDITSMTVVLEALMHEKELNAPMEDA